MPYIAKHSGITKEESLYVRLHEGVAEGILTSEGL